VVYGPLAMDPFTRESVPRCTARPSGEDIKRRRDLAKGKWECGLPAGHEDYPDSVEVTRFDESSGEDVTDFVDGTRHQPHSWGQTGDVSDA
jgi:hypothetical protein